MNLYYLLDAMVGAAFLFGLLALIVLGVFSLEKTEKKKREYIDEKKRYYNNINKSLEKENLPNVDSEK